MAENVYQSRFGAPREPNNRVNPGRGLVTVINFVTVSNWRAVLFLAICGFLMFLPGFFNIPPIDRDEARRRLQEAGGVIASVVGDLGG